MRKDVQIERPSFVLYKKRITMGPDNRSQTPNVGGVIGEEHVQMVTKEEGDCTKKRFKLKGEKLHQNRTT